MTQLELPPISFARYLDLLKRRRWQVLPVTVLGLLVGALVAFLIPRYYVCQTSLVFRGSVLTDTAQKDPMEGLVESAELSIRYSVGEALEALAWPEMAGEPEERRAFVDAVRGRVQVVDLGPHRDRRMSTNLRIIYKDTDPYRAKELTDKLRDTWIAEEQKGLRETADRELKGKTAEIGLAKRVLDEAQFNLAEFAKRNKLNPQDLMGQRDGVLDARSRELATVEGEIASTEASRNGFEAALETRQEQLAREPLKLRVTVPPIVPPAVQQRIDAATVEVMLAAMALSKMREGHPEYEMYRLRKEQAEKQLAALQEVVGGPAQAEDVDNPARARLATEIDTLTAQVSSAEGELVRLRQRKASLEKQIADLPQIITDYRRYEASQQAAKAELDLLVAEHRDMVTRKNNMVSPDRYEVKEWAQVQPRPTDPNITLVALAGSAVGLAFAIGLILLIDILQTTFKTPDDVERLLSLPVLGGMSYLMTAERRKLVSSRRTKVGVVAGVFLLLSISLVTIYYVDKTRLPPMVRDTLEMILGPTGPASAPR